LINNENIASASHKKTNDKAFEVISFLANKKTKILDVGAGKGHLSRRVYNFLSENNLNPRKQLIASDFSAKSFKAQEVTFKQADFNKRLPFKNKSFDIVYSIEVIEHLRSPYDFLEECFRILKPNGTLIISTPNTFNLYSRFKFLITGFFDLYKPPSIKPENAGRLCGHIMPLHIAYYDYGLRRVGFGEMNLICDKVSSKSRILYYLLFPFIRIIYWRQVMALKKYDIDLYNEVKSILIKMSSYVSMTSRSLFFISTKNS